MHTKSMVRKSALCVAAAGLLVVAGASARAQAGASPSIDGIWKDPEFQKRFMGDYGFRTDIEPAIKEEEKILLAEVLTYFADDNMATARQRLEEITAVSGASAAFDFLLGRIHFQGGDYEKAAAAFEAATGKFSNFLRAQKNLGLVYMRLQETEKAIPVLAKTIELGERSSMIYGLLGYAYSGSEKYMAAETAYRQAILFDPDARNWQLGLMQALFRQGKYAEATGLCNELIATADGVAADLWNLQANAYLGLNDPKKAAQNFEYLRTMGELKPESLNTLGDIYVNEKYFDLAAEVYAESLELKPDQSSDRPLRNAAALAQRGADEPAKVLIAAIRKAYKGQLDDDAAKNKEKKSELLKLEARIAMREGDDATQAKILRDIIDLNPRDGEALIMLGRYHARREGEIDNAINYYERAAKIEEFEARAKIRHGQLLVADGDYAGAIPLLTAALQIKHRQDVADYLEQVKAAAKSKQ